MYFGRHLLEQYKTCESAEAVSAMQEKILADLERSYEESRRTSGVYSFPLHTPLAAVRSAVQRALFAGTLFLASHVGGWLSRRACFVGYGGYRTTFRLSQPRRIRVILRSAGRNHVFS